LEIEYLIYVNKIGEPYLMSENFKIYIIFDNKCVKEGFLPGYGFSALIYSYLTQNYLLFDTGGNAEVLFHNLNKFNVHITDIKKVILSHDHYDHTGGLDGIYKRNPNIEIYVPIEHKQSYKNRYHRSKIIGTSNYTEIEKNVYSSGQFGDHIKEQALFLKSQDNKIIIIVGCTHPGLENFILKAREISNIKAIFGGFHGFRKYSYLKDIDIIGACHCTANISDIQTKFPNQFKKICVGNSFSF